MTAIKLHLSRCCSGKMSVAVKALVLHLCFETGQNVFFTTRDGRIGIGPPQVQKGDTVVLLYSGVKPCVLRRRSVFDVLVGDAYVL